LYAGGHGDYHPIVLAPASVQEAIDLTVQAFDLADKYRSIVVVMADGSVGQMMEPAEFPEMRPLRTVAPDYATNGAVGRKPRVLTSIFIDPPAEEVYNIKLLNRWYEIQANEVQYKEYFTEDAEYLIVGFGTAGRIALSAVRSARAEGIKVGLLRPVTVSPFPSERIAELCKKMQGLLVVEMNTGQMLDDVRLAVKDSLPIEFYGRCGGMVPYAEEILDEIHRLVRHTPKPGGDSRQRWLQRINDGVIKLG